MLGEISHQSTLAMISDAIYDKINLFRQRGNNNAKDILQLILFLFYRKNNFKHHEKSKAFLFFLNYRDS